MDLAFQIFCYVVWLPLEFLTISAILRSGPRKYPFPFAYVVVCFLTAVAEMPGVLSRHLTHVTQNDFWFWIDEGIRDLLVVTVVISFIYRASSKLETRRLVRFGLIVFGMLFVGISLLVHYQAPPAKIGAWMTPWTRDLNFVAAILDLALWFLLIISRERDYRLLMLSGGMGIMFAGEAIGVSIRNLALRERSHWVFLGGGMVMLLADVAFLYIWWRAFRTQSVPTLKAAPSPVAPYPTQPK